ncbi:hypothetical protein OZ411_40185 [Bradyrhizobium sp. Arg237L]|uniref:hypothetical protein n=1 Tax=Bradyrhizobium sp. Arg237L TaxID=3003352 RepID=UPI00249F5694|nr:hypothetical protein [Bradyrhizobium sp. Arg237L]MDI4239011.1 hypothetical protein [Bradyrhizobium sp. Arg237L]
MTEQRTTPTSFDLERSRTSFIVAASPAHQSTSPKIKIPSFILSTREDIAPWKSTYAATRLYSGPIKFVLSASGHMAGVIGAPGSKYGHWTNDNLPADPDQWLFGATSHQGSWWPVWNAWWR